MAEVNLGFLKTTDEDQIEFRLIAPTGNVINLSMTRTNNQRIEKNINALPLFGDES